MTTGTILTVAALLTAGTVLPPPEPKFKGVIGRTYKESKMDKIPIVKAPVGAPNVLLVLIDDSGFAQWGRSADKSPLPIWTAWPRTVFASPAFTPPRFARRRARLF